MSGKDFVPFEERPKPKEQEDFYRTSAQERHLASLRQNVHPCLTPEGLAIGAQPMSDKAARLITSRILQQNIDPDGPIVYTPDREETYKHKSAGSGEVASTGKPSGMLGQPPELKPPQEGQHSR